MKYFHKAAALLLTLCCAVPVLTGCSSSPRHQQNIAEEDMPYGSTMREDKTSFAIPVTYDRRFLEQEQVAKVADLVASIQDANATQYQSATFPFYVDYQVSQVYHLGSPDALIRKLHESLEGRTAEDYKFKMLLINDIATNTEAGELSVVCEMLESAYTGEGKFMDTVQKAYDLTVEWNLSYENDTKYAVVNDQHIFLFQTADGWFALM